MEYKFCKWFTYYQISFFSSKNKRWRVLGISTLVEVVLFVGGRWPTIGHVGYRMSKDVKKGMAITIRLRSVNNVIRATLSCDLLSSLEAGVRGDWSASGGFLRLNCRRLIVCEPPLLFNDLSWFDEGPVGITTCFKSFLNMCVSSYSFPSPLEGTLSPCYWRVLNTPNLCSRGWCKSKSSYSPVSMDFQ